ncbi:MAG TPA: MFS transporter, partial [Mycobacteriales bacterium]|nr:MFS transporter [Mycobacteriales bacterium]
AIVVLGLAPVLWLALLALAVAGAADTVSAVWRQSVLQAATPDEYRGRLGGVFIVVVAGGPRLGDVRVGGAAALLGPGTAVVGGGLLIMGGAALLAALVPRLVRYDARDPQA